MAKISHFTSLKGIPPNCFWLYVNKDHLFFQMLSYIQHELEQSNKVLLCLSLNLFHSGRNDFCYFIHMQISFISFSLNGSLIGFTQIDVKQEKLISLYIKTYQSHRSLMKEVYLNFIISKEWIPAQPKLVF